MSEEQYGPRNTPDFKNFDQNQEKILWKDRKRILGMPISFTRYAIDMNSLISRIGLIRTTTNDILLYRILDIKMTQTLGQKLFGVGSLVLYTADQSDSQFKLINIKRPEKVRRFMNQIIEQERDRRRLSGRELFGVAAAGMADIDGDGIPD